MRRNLLESFPTRSTRQSDLLSHSRNGQSSGLVVLTVASVTTRKDLPSVVRERGIEEAGLIGFGQLDRLPPFLWGVAAISEEVSHTKKR